MSDNLFLMRLFKNGSSLKLCSIVNFILRCWFWIKFNKSLIYIYIVKIETQAGLFSFGTLTGPEQRKSLNLKYEECWSANLWHAGPAFCYQLI